VLPNAPIKLEKTAFFTMVFAEFLKITVIEVHKGGKKPLRLSPAQPGGGQRLLAPVAGHHRQHGRGRAAATGRSAAQ
jgi:hypothetical protein